MSIVVGSNKISEKYYPNFNLYVPNISCNLLSISKLTKDFSDIAKFSSSCEFQELHSRKTIDNAKVHEGLYFFRGEDSRTRQPLAFGFKSISVSDDEIMLWHHKLSHPSSFPYLKILFPYLFKNKDPHSFQCEIVKLPNILEFLSSCNHTNHRDLVPLSIVIFRDYLG